MNVRGPARHRNGRFAAAEYDAEVATMTPEEQRAVFAQVTSMLQQAMQNTLYGCYQPLPYRGRMLPLRSPRPRRLGHV